MTTYADLKTMTDDQLCRWLCARRGVFSGQEKAALRRLLDEMPHRAQAIPAEWLKVSA